MNNQDVIEKIKSAFCNLTSFKLRQNEIEVITAYSTLNSKFVSVFITFTNSKIVLNDGGWICQNYYNTPLYDKCEETINKIKNSYITSYKIKSTIDPTGVEYFYKTCSSVDEIPSSVFDLANFIVGVINAFCIQFNDEREERERETFRRDANDFLKANYSEHVKLKQALDDFKTIKFNAIINKSSKLYLVTYVTGSTQTYFENDLRKSIVNFEIAFRSRYHQIIKERVTLINDQSEGYQPNKSAYYFDLLNEKTTQKPIKWSEKEKVLEFI